MRTIGAAMVSSLGIRVFGLFLFFSGVAAGGDLALNVAPETGITVVPNTIVSIPLVARAVLAHDVEQLISVLEKGANINEPVRAKDGVRAGFTPIILAAALSDVPITKTLVEHGASVGIVDDFNRSAFWYAALRDNFAVTQVLMSAKGAEKVVDAADSDLRQTPLHIAVSNDDPQMVRFLIKMGPAARDKRDILGETPVDYCRRELDNAACRELF